MRRRFRSSDHPPEAGAPVDRGRAAAATILRTLIPCCLAACLALGVVACGGGGSRPRVLVLGFDGADPDAIDLLMSEGKLPNFAKMRQGGAYGRLKSAVPLLSPVVWTTIATGKTPDQ